MEDGIVVEIRQAFDDIAEKTNHLLRAEKVDGGEGGVLVAGKLAVKLCLQPSLLLWA